MSPTRFFCARSRAFARLLVLPALVLLFLCPTRSHAQCRDPWVTQSVREVMNRPANGTADTGECNYRNYGGGSWSNYPDLKQKVINYFNGTCRDPWVTQAVSEVRGRRPQGYGDTGECNYRNYGGGSWSNYPDLKQKVQIAFGLASAPAPAPPAPRYPAPSPAPAPAPAPAPSINAGSNPSIMSMIQAGYQRDFGRAPTQAELNYWASVPVSNGSLRTPAAFQQTNMNYLRGSASERQRIIQQAFGQTWNINLSPAAPEFKYWDGVLSAGQANYSDLVRANQQLRSANPSYRPGMNPPMHFTPPTGNQYALQATDGTMLADTFALLGKEFNFLQMLGTAMTGGMLPPPPGPLATPPARGSSNPPQVITPPNRGVAGPYVIAATPDSQPNLSFCLDTGSWNAGAQVVAALCHGKGSQLFDIDSENHIYMTNNPHGRLCLDGGSKPWPGDPRKPMLTLEPCSNSSSQHWYVNTIPGLHVGNPWTDNYSKDHVIDHSTKEIRYSGGQIQNIGNGYCIDIQGAATSTTSGNPVIMWDCQTGGKGRVRPWNQVWGAGHVMTNGTAYVFFRYAPPFNLGHTSWAIELPDGSWEAGGEDGFAFASTDKGTFNGTFRQHFSDETALRNWFQNSGLYAQYDRYMRFDVPRANSAAAFSLESQGWDWGYGVLGNNCVDMTVKVLHAYGLTSLPIVSREHPIPQEWFFGLPGSNNAYYLHH